MPRPEHDTCKGHTHMVALLICGETPFAKLHFTATPQEAVDKVLELEHDEDVFAIMSNEHRVELN